MTPMNPYAAPAFDAAPLGFPQQGAADFYREGDSVVVPKQLSELPDRCILCNAPANGHRLRKTFYWHTPALYVLAFISPLIYAIVALIVRKSASVAFGLCEAHRTKRRNGIVLAIGSLFFFLALLIVGAVNESPGVAIVSGLLMFIVPIVGAVMARTTHATKIDDFQAWLRAGQPFLESLPFAPGMAAMGPPVPAGWNQQQGAWGTPFGAPSGGLGAPMQGMGQPAGYAAPPGGFGAPGGPAPQAGWGGPAAPPQGGWGAPAAPPQGGWGAPGAAPPTSWGPPAGGAPRGGYEPPRGH